MFNVHEEFCEHEKVSEKLENACRDELEMMAALGIWLRMGTDCRLRMTDGHFTEARLRKLTGKAAKLAPKLVEAELWDRTDDGYVFHDWADVQETKAYIQERRRKDRNRKRGKFHKDSTPESDADSARNPDGIHTASARRGVGRVDGVGRKDGKTDQKSDHPPPTLEREPSGIPVAVAFVEHSNGRWAGSYSNDPRAFDAVGANCRTAGVSPAALCKLFWQRVKFEHPGPAQLNKMCGALLGELKGAAAPAARDPYSHLPVSR